ncbi:E3 ubiquitin-protein ligase [Lachnellula occidentalis]|uniref:E3 ubiquitin-protein ligase n=1 Tax=Lachnellula occidentalis TaxID=215460 RepID=A0A8H8SAK5_9HELO|nr:E3 ubiquitin-protein ligase [Lachnellula occidentalis]
MVSIEAVSEPNEYTGSAVSSQLAEKKRKSRAAAYSDEDEDYGGAINDEVAEAAAQAALAGIDERKAKRARKKKGEEPEEKRLRRTRVKAPATYLERLHRVKTQKMFLIERIRTTSGDGTHEEEVFDIAGTTGNIYQVTVSKAPSCSCPDGMKNNQCKHIIYVLVNVLKTREDLAYQLAFLTTELNEIFANAPTPPQSDDAPSTATDTGGQRKPIDGDCPVCAMEFEEDENIRGEIIWCKAACGQNVHRHCFEQWARAKPGQDVKCVYCRSLWKGDEDTIKRITQGGQVNAEGYVNVAGELGLSGQRDMSTYHPFWVRKQQGYNGDYGDYDGY